MNRAFNATLSTASLGGLTGSALLADQMTAVIPLLAPVLVELIRIFWPKRG